MRASNGLLLLMLVALAAAGIAPRGLLYTADFAKPLRVQYEADLLNATGQRAALPTAEWVLESEQNASGVATAGGKLSMTNAGSHMVLWLNRPFPANTELRFGLMPHNTSVGLSIVFFGAAPLTNVSKYAGETSIFGLSLPARGGAYKNYHSGALQCYSDSYYRAGNWNQSCQLNPSTGRCCANLRKNPGFNLVQQGDDLIIHRAPKNGVAFEVVVRRAGDAHAAAGASGANASTANITVSVDGEDELTWIDDGPGPPLGGGYIGLRQMASMGTGTYTHFDVYAA